MVVLSAAIVKKDKTLVARQFVEMTRLRIEGLLGAFTKLVDSGKDHTFVRALVETERATELRTNPVARSVRYVYQPMEALNLVVITNKASNILEDLETLRLLAKVVQDCCEIQVSEENVEPLGRAEWMSTVWSPLLLRVRDHRLCECQHCTVGCCFLQSLLRTFSLLRCSNTPST
ncbi:Arcn1 [Symbiodinium necroappetens]|uniref:Coatomer subunit delta n=1 Tax=Symbiodinium necroappetens TaxID=1628268 RepID=A0A812LI37_9DINO|nr:Arcn1 [Symbiodinium necroappetens]